MKKLLLFAVGAMMAMPIIAQEEDVTHLIQNAGFDEDLTFQADGTMKAMVEQQSLSDRSWAYIAADKTVYARPKETSSQQRTDGRSKLDAVNGFHGQVTGWTLDGVTFPKCEWMYYGVVPYGLPTDAVPIADDGNGYLLVPEKPEGFTGDDNKGMLYMRAGWTNSCSYKQVVKLPCAQYRLEYWTINVNPNSSATATDLTEIICRKDHFKDETGAGLSSTTWTKHEFEFTPTAEFTMVFGYKSANQTSNNNPWVCLDGIKLYKIGEADREELLAADLADQQNEIADLAAEANNVGLIGLASLMNDYAGGDIEDVIGGDVTEMSEMYIKTQTIIEKLKAAIAAAPALDAAVAKIEKLLQETDYPGKAELQAVLDELNGYYEATGWDDVEALADAIIAASEKAETAIFAYTMSQQGSQDNPADYTSLVRSPWFVQAGYEPTGADDSWVQNDETADHLNSDGWYIGESGGDQAMKVCQSLPCWNAWKQGIGYVSISQDLTNIPNGYYQVSALMITQQDYANETQHVFAKSSLGTFKSETLKFGLWDNTDNATGTGEWTRLTTTMALVTDGKLTIGAAGEGKGATDQSGWFCVTGFKLYYLGEADANAVNDLLEQAKSEALAFAEGMHFAADKAALMEAINATGDPAEVLAALNTAFEEAKTSEAKYEEYMQEGKTLPTVQATLSGEGYEAATEIVKFAYDQTIDWMNSAEATYKNLDAKVNLLKNYLSTYAPVYNEAAKLAQSVSGTAKEQLEAVMNKQKAELTAEMKDADTVKAFVDELQTVMTNASKQAIWDTPGATDYTGFIMNPMLASEAGWTFDKGNGNNNTGAGQWLNGDASVRYIDSYNSEGLVGYIAQQTIVGLPNGTYTLGAYTRTPAEGAYIFYATGAEAAKTFVEIPLNYYIDGEGAEQVASDSHGPVWEEAKAAFEAGSEDETVLAIYNANGGNGRGWKHQEATVTVDNHVLVIGAAAGSIENLQTEKDFAGSWFSVGGWTLTLTAAGNNDGWAGPFADGIDTIAADNAAADGIYNLNGVKMGKLQRGLNIIVANGKASKVMVK